MATEKFNPHHKWLGISPNEFPYDHYRLLAIGRFENDPDVIENAGWTIRIALAFAVQASACIQPGIRLAPV
jgi:hypothetical protein